MLKFMASCFNGSRTTNKARQPSLHCRGPRDAPLAFEFLEHLLELVQNRLDVGQIVLSALQQRHVFLEILLRFRCFTWMEKHFQADAFPFVLSLCRPTDLKRDKMNPRALRGTARLRGLSRTPYAEMDC